MSIIDPASIFSNLNVTTSEELYSSIYNDDSGVLQAFYCSLNDTAINLCGGLCPNTDLAGVGVRVAFYAQAVFNVVLVLKSPDDSAAGQWAAVILTLALIIPAMIQKLQGNLTLFHATLVLNFATLSTLASLAVAPRCTVWRAEDAQDSRVRREERGRVMLSLALITQIIIQWAWAIIMFTMPQYAQPYCNAQTLLFFFGQQLYASEIDRSLLDSADPAYYQRSYFYVWPLWLLFCISLTMAYFIILAISSSSSLLPTPAASIRQTPWATQPYATPRPRSRARSRVRDGGSRSRSPSRAPLGFPGSHSLPKHSLWRKMHHRLVKHLRPLLPYLPHLPQSRSAAWLLSHNTFAVIFFLFLVIITEVQHAGNPWLLPGENDATSFGQMAALLLATAPLWSICMAWWRGESPTAVQTQDFLPLAVQQTRRARHVLHAIVPPSPDHEESGAPSPISPPGRPGPSKYANPYLVAPPPTPPRGPRPRRRQVVVQSPDITPPRHASTESLAPMLPQVDISEPLDMDLSWPTGDGDEMENIPLTMLQQE